MKKLVALLATTLATSFTLKAATPVAVWDGDFSATQTGFTLDRSGNAISQDNSTITIDQSVGVKVDFTTGFSSAMTVMFKYSDLAFDAQKTLATSFCSGYDENRTGVYLAAGGTANGIWNTANWNNPMGTLSESSGVLAFSYSKTGGTGLYYISTNGVRTQIYNKGNLNASGDAAINGCTIGGERAKQNATLLSAATDMKITGIAIFDGILTEAEMTGYLWPSETQTITVFSNTTVSAIKAQYDPDTYKGVAVSVADGVTITIDEAFGAAIKSVSSTGSITLSAASQPDASYLANVDFSGVQGGLLRSWLTPGVVGFNFTSAKGSDTTGALVEGEWFSVENSANDSSASLFSDGLSTLTWASGGTWSYNNNNSPSTASMICAYLDDGLKNGHGAEVYLSNVPYETYDVIVYCSSDSNPGQFLAKTVNGTTYTCDLASGAVVEGRAVWGKAALSTPVYGVNAMRIKNLSGPLTIYGGARNGSIRGGIAAIQIMPPNTPDNIRTYKLALDGTATTWSGGTWTLNGESADAPTSGFVEIEATASTALTVDQAVSLADLKVRGGTDIIINVSTNGTGSLYAIKATVESGVFQQGSPAVLGATPSIVVASGATFDENGMAVNAANAVTIAGAGAGSWPWALTSSSGAGGAILGGLCLSANATIGGANELKVGQTQAGYQCYLQGFTLTKTGAGAFTGTNMNTPGTGTIEVQGGDMSVNQWNNLNNNGGDTTVILNSGTSLANGTNRIVPMSALGLYGGTLSTASKAFKVNTALRGTGETANLVFGDGASASLTGDLTVTATMTLDGSMTFLKDAEATSDVVVTPAALTASSGTISVGDGVTLNLATNRPAATLSFASGAGLVVRLKEGESAVSLAADSTPSSYELYDAGGARINSAKMELAGGVLTVYDQPVVTTDAVLHISEICPKPTARDPNGVEAGWIEIHNTSDTFAANLSDYSLTTANRGSEIKAAAALPDVLVRPGEYKIVYTTKEYPKEGINDGSTPFITNGIIVAQLKINPKKFPVVQLWKGKEVVDSFIVPVDLPDNASFAPAGGSWGDYSGVTVEPVEEETVEPAEEVEISDSMLTVSSSVSKNETEGFYSFANVTNGKEGILIDKSAIELMAEKDMYSISLTFRVTNNTAQSESTGMPLFFCRNSNTSAPYSGILAYINKAPYGNIIIQIRDAGKSNRDYQVDSELDWLDGKWHTLEVSCGQTGSSRIAVSVDGVKYVDTTCGVAATLNTNMPMCIGRAYDSSSWTAFTGDIKDIHLYTGDDFPAPLPDPAEETSDKTEIVDATTVTRVILPTITPGSVNNRAGEIAYGPNAGPLYGIKHKVSDWKAWAQAKVGENYSVTLALNPMDDDPTNAIQSVSLAYRTDFSSIGFVTMEKGECVENEGQLWTATIPGSAITQAGHILRWAAVATDAAGNKWRTPSFCDPDNAYEWYGTLIEPPADLISEKLQTFHIFADSTAQANMDKQYDSISGAIPYGARVQIYDSQTGFYYDNVRIDLRGNTTAGFRKKSHGIRFIKSQPLTCTNPFTGETIDGLRKVSFIAEYSDPSFIRQALAFQLFKDMGLNVPYSYPVRLNMNGQFFQMAFHSNRFSDELIEDYYGLDPLGYSYKSVGTLRGATSAGGTEKKTPDDGNDRDLSVLSAFYSTFSDADNINESFEGDGMASEIPAVTKTVVKKFDLPAWLNYLAAARITQECDDVWANLCAYYDVNGTDTWMPLGYDFNVSLGAIYLDDRNYATYKYPIDKTMSNVDNFKSHPFYGGNRVRCHRYNSSTTINSGNRGFEAVWQSLKFRRLYLRRLRTVMDEQLKAPGTTKENTPFWSNYVVAYTNAIAVDAALDRAKWGSGAGTTIYWWPNAMNLEEGIADLWDNYVVPRREHLFVTHSVTNTAKAIGYGRGFNAGIPNAQSPLADLKAGFSVVNTTDETKTAIDDAEKIVIRNANAEAVDMSGWRLTGRFNMTLPAGTVVDADDTIIVVVDRKAYVAAHDAELTDQVIVGNAGLAADTTSFTLFDANGTEVVKVAQPSNESKFLRFFAWDGVPVDDDDNGTGEWVTLTNISDTVTLDLAGVNVKIGKDTTAPKCNITLADGTLPPGGTITLKSVDFGLANGWEKITNNKIYLQLTDAAGTIGQTSQEITQKEFADYYSNRLFYLQATSFGATFAQSDVIEVPYPVTIVEVGPGEDVALEAATQEEADAALADCVIVLSADDEEAGLVADVLKLVAVPVVSVDPQTSIETTTYVARVEVDETKVPAPMLGQIEEGEATVDPLTVESDEEGSKVTVGVSNATVGLWYGFIWTDSLGDKPFENDVESFKRATSTSVKIESKAEAAKSAQKAFFRVKVSATKP